MDDPLFSMVFLECFFSASCVPSFLDPPPRSQVFWLRFYANQIAEDVFGIEEFPLSAIVRFFFFFPFMVSAFPCAIYYVLLKGKIFTH